MNSEFTHMRALAQHSEKKKIRDESSKDRKRSFSVREFMCQIRLVHFDLIWSVVFGGLVLVV